MRIDVVTLFPEMILEALGHSMMQRAQDRGLVSFRAVNPRDFTTDVHRTVDDVPFAGGPGMVMMLDPLCKAMSHLEVGKRERVILPDPTGRLFGQPDASRLATEERLVFVCGHYEGIDGRFAQLYDAETLSLGDFVLTGGELPALCMIDSIVRLLPGVLGDAASLQIDSLTEGLLSAPQFTKPRSFAGLDVPPALLDGDHGAAERWKRQVALLLTRSQRPDLLCRAPLRKSDLDLL